jgi:ABC-type phosphate transport system permease subunit
MAGIPTVFGDGILDVHVANGVARITLGAVVGQQNQGAEAKPQTQPSAMLVVPVMQLPVLARVLAEVTKQVEQRAKEAMAQARPAAPAEPAPAAATDQVAGAFRFNG